MGENGLWEGRQGLGLRRCECDLTTQVSQDSHRGKQSDLYL